MKLISINPGNEKVLKKYRSYSYLHCKKIINELKREEGSWKNKGIDKRIECIKKVKEILKKDKKNYSRLITLEMGKPLAQSEEEIEKCIELCDYYIKHSKDFLKNEVIKTEYHESYIVFEPLGTILGIMPWNYPFWQVFRSVIPSIISGNSYALKHSSNTPSNALEIEKIFIKAGIKIFRTMLCDSKTALKLIPLVQGVSFTGSISTGKVIGKTSGEYLKKCILELGGNDPLLVLDNKRMDEYVTIAAKSRLKGMGQSCTAAKRFIVLEKHRKEFEKKVVGHFSSLIIGDPLEKNVQIGPLVNEERRKELKKQIENSIKKGAKILIGGKKLNGKGYFFEPTVITNVRPGMDVFEEETFGPVFSIISAKSEKEAINLANKTRYGLGASILIQDIEKAKKISEQLESGMVFTNKALSSDIRFPAGGIKDSGIGKELSHYGIKEFVNAKTIIINKL